MSVTLANLAWMSHAALGARRWERLTTHVEQAQEEVLARILRPNADTAFARDHGLRALDSVADFRRRVPVRRYDELLPWIERAADGESHVLTAEPIVRFGVSSGTTSASKLVPYTESLLREFRTGIGPWALHLFRRRPGLLTGTCYWSITPVAAAERVTRGGIPVGFEDERRYLGRAGRWILDTVLPVPAAVGRLDEIDRFRFVTLRLLLEQESLAWVSVWNPTFLTLLVEPLLAWHEPLLESLASGTITPADDVPPDVLERLRPRPERARRLRAIFARRAGLAATARDDRGRTLYEEVWPRLVLISCWGDAAAADALPVLRQHFPRAAVQRKGLVATEAFVSFPLTDELAALSLGSHFFEFCEAESPGRVRLAHELERGRTYSIVITTGGGLYRYRIGDLVEVVGFHRACPLIRFIGREDVVDLRGEKLNDRFVGECAERVLAEAGVEAAFWLLAPVTGEDSLAYVLFVETGSPDVERLVRLGKELEAQLRRSYHYDYCRRLGQLGPCRVFRIDAGANAGNLYLTGRARLGQRLGDVKPAAVDAFDGWAELLPGRFV